MKQPDFNNIRMDALRELCSIATGHAAISLSTMVRRRVDITVPNIMIEAIEKVASLLGRDDRIVTTIDILIGNEVAGGFILTMPLPEALHIAGILTQRTPGDSERLDEMEISALKELGNIMAGSYIRILVNGTSINLYLSTPLFSTDRLVSILNGMVARMSTQTKYALIIENNFFIKEDVFHAKLILIITPETVKTITKPLM